MLSPHARFAIATLMVLGCGGGSGAPKDGGGDGSLGGQGNGAGAGGGIGGAGGSGTVGPMPTGSPVFIGASASLLTQGPPCTWEKGATGDRWCAFIAESTTTPGKGDLFVVNVTKVAAGTAITCGLTDANCLKLTGNYGENQDHPALFGGDTLVYYELTGAPFAWRPGMTAGRALAVADPVRLDVVLCTPSLKGTAVYCLRDLPDAMQTDPSNLLLSDLIAGKIDDAANPPLVKVETVIAANRADMNFAHFQVDFPVPGSDTIAWSARATASGPEILKMQTLGNDASRVTVATDINSWRASPDGSRWYWLAGVNETNQAGMLQSAPYPGGASPVALAASTMQYDFPTPTSLLVVDSGESMLGFADPTGAPTVSTPVDTSVVAFIALSAQGHAAYVKTVASTSSGQTFTDLFVKKGDGTGACTITAATDGYPFDLIFTPSAGGVAWIQQAVSSVLARYTRLSDCTAMTVGSAVVWVEPIGERAVLFMDGYTSLTGTANMRYRNVAAGAISAEAATLVSGQVGTFTSTASGGADIVIYTVNGGGNQDGVYVKTFGP